MNKNVEYIYLKPRDMIERRNAFPVAYMGTGILEWHGLQNPLGLDGIKTHSIVVKIAEKFGGVVMPPQFWGDHRGEYAEVDFVEAYKPEFSFPENHFDHTVLIAEAMGIEKSTYDKENERSEQLGGWEFWEKLMARTMFEIESIGFKAIIMFPGHYPSIAPMRRAVERYYLEGGQSKVLVLTETAFTVGEFMGDHAASYETSMMLALYPELVDIGELDSDLSKPNIGVIGWDPRVHASKELGERILNELFRIAEEFLKENKLI